MFNGSASLEGDTRVAVQVAQQAAGSFRVRVLTTPGEAAHAFASASAEVVELSGPATPGKIGNVVALFRASFAAVRHALHKNTIVYTYDRTRYADIAMLAAMLCRHKFIYHMNTAFIDHHRYRSRLAKHAASVWAVSRFVDDVANEHGIKNHRVLLNCLSQDVPTITKEEARAFLNIPSDHLAVVLVGRLSPFKGQETLIRAFADPQLSALSLHCYIVGGDCGEGKFAEPPTDSYLDHLRRLVAEPGIERRVTFLGGQPGTTAFKAADIACVLSDAESFGLVVAEAVACCAPLVATRTGGNPRDPR